MKKQNRINLTITRFPFSIGQTSLLSWLIDHYNDIDKTIGGFFVALSCCCSCCCYVTIRFIIRKCCLTDSLSKIRYSDVFLNIFNAVCGSNEKNNIMITDQNYWCDFFVFLFLLNLYDWFLFGFLILTVQLTVTCL